jgi:hypothetical protein
MRFCDYGVERYPVSKERVNRKLNEYSISERLTLGHEPATIRGLAHATTKSNRTPRHGRKKLKLTTQSQGNRACLRPNPSCELTCAQDRLGEPRERLRPNVSGSAAVAN